MDQIELKTKTLEDLRYIAKMMGQKSIATYKKTELDEVRIGRSGGQDAKVAGADTKGADTDAKVADAKVEINDKVQSDNSSPKKIAESESEK